MAKPRTLSFGNFRVWVGSSDSPGTYSEPCGFDQKSFTIEAETSDTTLPDCDDPEAVAWTERGVSVLSATVNGQGVMAMASLDTWRDWALSGAARQVRVEFDDTGANGGGYYEGDAILQSLGHSVALDADGKKTQLAVNMISTGEWTWTDNP